MQVVSGKLDMVYLYGGWSGGGGWGLLGYYHIILKSHSYVVCCMFLLYPSSSSITLNIFCQLSITGSNNKTHQPADYQFVWNVIVGEFPAK